MFVTPAFAQEAAPAAAQAHTETGVPAEGHPAFPPFDAKTYPSALLWLVITFGIFYVVMRKAVIPRVGGILEQRQKRMAQDLEEASRLKAEADAAVETYESELAAARAKAQSIGATARDAAKAKAEADRRSLEAELAAKLKTAEERINELKAKAFADVGAIAEETAAAVIEHIGAGNVASSDIAAAVASVSAKHEG